MTGSAPPSAATPHADETANRCFRRQGAHAPPSPPRGGSRKAAWERPAPPRPAPPLAASSPLPSPRAGHASLAAIAAARGGRAGAALSPLPSPSLPFPSVPSPSRLVLGPLPPPARHWPHLRQRWAVALAGPARSSPAPWRRSAGAAPWRRCRCRLRCARTWRSWSWSCRRVRAAGARGPGSGRARPGRRRGRKPARRFRCPPGAGRGPGLAEGAGGRREPRTLVSPPGAPLSLPAFRGESGWEGARLAESWTRGCEVLRPPPRGTPFAGGGGVHPVADEPRGGGGGSSCPASSAPGAWVEAVVEASSEAF